jgi:hypothetical protein
MMANWPWTPEGEEELLELDASGVLVAIGSEKARQTKPQSLAASGTESETGRSQERGNVPQLAASFISNVTCWHFSDLTKSADLVRSWGRSGLLGCEPGLPRLTEAV